MSDTRWKQRFSNFSAAMSMLSEFMEKAELNKFEEQGLIQCFEYSFELGWKTLKDFLEEEGLNPKTPRETIQLAFQADLISEGHIWIDALEKRNLLSHSYSEELAKEGIFYIKEKYFNILKKLFNLLSARL